MSVGFFAANTTVKIGGGHATTRSSNGTFLTTGSNQMFIGHIVAASGTGAGDLEIGGDRLCNIGGSPQLVIAGPSHSIALINNTGTAVSLTGVILENSP